MPVTTRRRRERGQVLIMVAISLFVLIGVIALAVDVGHWYGQRRHMQNAADAAALAGAYEICINKETSDTIIRATAIEYAERNGADAAMVDVLITDPTGTETAGDIPSVRNTVVVTAGVAAETFFARLFGLETVDVGAVAAAACGKASEGCGAMPIAFDYDTFRDPSFPCSEFTYHEDPVDPTKSYWTLDRLEIGSLFVLWADDNLETRNPTLCDDCMCEDLDEDILQTLEDHWGFDPENTTIEVNGGETTWAEWKDACAPETDPSVTPDPAATPDPLCASLHLIQGGQPMNPGARGWLRLGLEKPYSKPAGAKGGECNSLHSCGSALECWLKYGYTGTLVEGKCIKGQSGVNANSLKAAQSTVGKLVSFVLYDDDTPCGTLPGDEIIANCSNDDTATEADYRIQDFACGLVLHVYDGTSGGDITLSPSIDATFSCPGAGCECPHKEAAILMAKACEPCNNTTCAGTTGTPQQDLEMGAVSLIPVP
jgi:hypothetical protein